MDVEVEFIGARVVKPVDDTDKTREYKNIKRAYQVLVSGKGIGPDDSNPPPSTRPGGIVWLFTLLMLEQIQPIVAQGKRHEKSCKLPMFLSDYPLKVKEDISRMNDNMNQERSGAEMIDNMLKYQDIFLPKMFAKPKIGTSNGTVQLDGVMMHRRS